MGQTRAEAPSLLPDGGLRSAVSTDQGRGAGPTSFGRRVRVDAKPRYLLNRDHDRLLVAIKWPQPGVGIWEKQSPTGTVGGWHTGWSADGCDGKRDWQVGDA